MPNPETVQAVSDWLIDAGLRKLRIEKQLEGLSLRLSALGLPLIRTHAAMWTLHPGLEGQAFTWRRGRAGDRFGFEPASSLTPDWQASPLFFAMQNDLLELRRRLSGPEARIDFPVLQEIAAEGGTDYLILRHFFSMGGFKQQQTGIITSWTTGREGGFSDGEVAVIKRLLPRFALSVSACLAQEVAENLADTYIGPEAGRRVLAGTIQRGGLERLDAVIMFADLRGFTALGDSLPPEKLPVLLNDSFDLLVPPVAAEGGQVLKFLGDGFLATFALEGRDTGEVARAAIRAARNGLSALRQAGATREAAGEPWLPAGVALHLGEVLYGNIGAADRLDFTVVGRTVNVASRLQALCRDLGRPLLISADMAAALGPSRPADTPLEDMGPQRLRGVAQAQSVFAVALEVQGQATGEQSGE